jgi:hypothetical protein
VNITDDYNTIRRTLIAERNMRKKVFSHNPEKLTEKVGEIDRALEALDNLHNAANAAKQPGLFD